MEWQTGWDKKGKETRVLEAHKKHSLLLEEPRSNIDDQWKSAQLSPAQLYIEQQQPIL